MMEFLGFGKKLNKRNHIEIVHQDSRPTCSDHPPFGFVLHEVIEPRSENRTIIVI